MTDDEVIAERNDLEMIRRPHMWPLGDRLALKKNIRTQPFGYDVGFIHKWHKTRVIIGFVWGDLDALEKAGNYKDYPSHEAILEDGWVVD